ncbi:hypothetical protein [Salinisphaera sp. S4-8]|uniref:hypothetical protein n=1 Tax=Salinisphaera sp. S4-8 TaxID=633357 RepID=UPI00333EF8F7
MRLPLVDVFKSPYEAWSMRGATESEMRQQLRESGHILGWVRDRLQERINTHYEAACYIASVGADNALEGFIDRQLQRCESYKSMRAMMPSRTPPALSRFQQRYPNYSVCDVDYEISRIGHTLSEGQQLFHGGVWPGADSADISLAKPFSMSFCPQVALRNAEWRGKAYDAGQINLLVLRVVRSSTPVFVFRQRGAKMGNEKEVLIASHANLSVRASIRIKDDYVVGKYGFADKTVPIYVCEVDIT